MQTMLRLLLYAAICGLLSSSGEAVLLRQGQDVRRQASVASGGATHQGARSRSGDPEDGDQREAVTREDLLMGAQVPAGLQSAAPMEVESTAEAALPTGLAAAQSAQVSLSNGDQQESFAAEQDVAPSMPRQQAVQMSATQLQQYQDLQRQMQELQVRQQQLLQSSKAPPDQVPSVEPRRQHIQSLVATRTAAATAAAQAPSMVGGGLAKPKGWDQCLHFARYVKEREVSGVELVKTWQATCQPAVRSGRASERYRMMCNSMAGAIEPFAAQADYNIEQLCDTVLALFHDLTAADAAAATR